MSELSDHVARCEKAGCGHPAFYDFSRNPPSEATASLGWCKLCRAEAVADGTFDSD